MRKPLILPWVVGLLIFLLVAMALLIVRRGKDVPEVAVSTHRESCQQCHAGMTGFSPSHNPDSIGCVACHLGDPDAVDKVMAHEAMVLIPGNLADAGMTCGSLGCHPGIDARVTLSLMNTMSGVVGVDRFVFGEVDSLDGFHDVKDLGDSAADTHLRNLCASCHLGQNKRETGPIHELSRGGGCNACHLNYSESAEAAHAEYLRVGKSVLPEIHPSLSLQVTDDHCFGCHSRSGRISTSYEGWHETLSGETGSDDLQKTRILEDGRAFSYIGDDVHHAGGLTCIDCHSSFDVMGSGRFAHQEEAVEADCRDCHTNERPATASYDQLDPEAQKIVSLRGINREADFVLGRTSGRPLINVFLNEGD